MTRPAVPPRKAAVDQVMRQTLVADVDRLFDRIADLEAENEQIRIENGALVARHDEAALELEECRRRIDEARDRERAFDAAQERAAESAENYETKLEDVAIGFSVIADLINDATLAPDLRLRLAVEAFAAQHGASLPLRWASHPPSRVPLIRRHARRAK